MANWEELVKGKMPEASIQELKAYEAELNQTTQLVSVLQSDFNSALEETRQDWENSARRRALTRSLFALVEGAIASLKSRVLSQYRRGDCDLSQAEFAILAEESYGLKESGRIRITPNFIPLKANIKFAFSIFAAKVGLTSFDLDTRSTGWQDFLKAIEIRNTLMHPKSLDELEFDDAKLECVLNAAEWFGVQFEALMDTVKEGIKVSVNAEFIEFQIAELQRTIARSIAREIFGDVDKEAGVILLAPDYKDQTFVIRAEVDIQGFREIVELDQHPYKQGKVTMGYSSKLNALVFVEPEDSTPFWPNFDGIRGVVRK